MLNELLPIRRRVREDDVSFSYEIFYHLGSYATEVSQAAVSDSKDLGQGSKPIIFNVE